MNRRSTVIPALLFAVVPLLFIVGVVAFQLLKNVPEARIARANTLAQLQDNPRGKCRRRGNPGCRARPARLSDYRPRGLSRTLYQGEGTAAAADDRTAAGQRGKPGPAAAAAAAGKRPHHQDERAGRDHHGDAAAGLRRGQGDREYECGSRQHGSGPRGFASNHGHGRCPSRCPPRHAPRPATNASA